MNIIWILLWLWANPDDGHDYETIWEWLQT